MNSGLNPDFSEFGLDFKKSNCKFIQFEKISGFNSEFINNFKYPDWLENQIKFRIRV